MKRLQYFQPNFESTDPNNGEQYKYPDTETPRADEDDKSIFFEYYNDEGTAYALEIFPNKRSSRLSYDRALRNGVWYYQDADTYIPLDMNTNEKPSGKSFDPTPIKVRWLNNAALPDYEYMIKSIEDEAQEGENLWRWIRATIAAVEWSFDNDIGKWKTKEIKESEVEEESPFEDPEIDDYFFDLITPEGKFSLRLLLEPDVFILHTPDNDEPINGSMIDLYERPGFYRLLADGGVIFSWIKFCFDRVKYSLQDSNDLSFSQYVIGDEKMAKK